MNYLITGGAGFIGSHFLSNMVISHPNDRFVCLDALTYAGNIENLCTIFHNNNFFFEKGDIATAEVVQAVFEKYHPDVVVNFAAESHVDRSIENATRFIQTNVVGTQVLLDACLKYGIKRFHQVSTDEVYGSLCDDKQVPFTENSILAPTNPYAASKAAADLLVLSYYKTHMLPVSISRCSNNYGPNQFPEKLIPKMVMCAMNDKLLPLYGNGNNVREWIFVEDHCIALEMILSYGKAGQIYNIGTNDRKSNLKLVREILKTLGKNDNLIQFVPDRPGHDKCYSMNWQKIRSELGWMPQTKFEKGLSLTISWYKNNPMWLKNILSGEYKNGNSL